MANSNNILFLHWGPGGNCEVERKWFGDSPVVWWDQPQFSADDVKAWTHLLDASAAALQSLARDAGPISLIGHSFGGQIALALSHRAPESIREITLLNASEFPPRAFLSLAVRMVKAGKGGPNLTNALEAARSRLTRETFWPLIGEITAAPDFMALYWGPGSAAARDKYFSLADPARIVDLPSFSAIMNSFFAAPRPSTPSPFRGPVRMIVGEHDPLMDASAEERVWRTHFPALERKTVNTGHFAHLESEATFAL